MKITHKLEYIATRLAAWPFQMLPHGTAVELGGRLGRAVGNLWAGRREIVIRNLELAYGESLSVAKREELAGEIFANIGRTMAEIARFPQLNPQKILQLVDSEGSDSFREALEYGHGAILIGSHFGNWELMGAYANVLGYPVDFLVRGQHNRYFDDYLTRLRRSCGVGVIHSERSMKEVIRALQNNRQVAIVSDQHAGSQGIVVRFFGRLVSVPRAPATLAVKFGAPIVTGYMLRRPNNTHHCIFERPIYPDAGEDAQQEIVRLTRIYTERIEKHIRQRPDLWLWTHRRFKTLRGNQETEGAYVD